MSKTNWCFRTFENKRTNTSNYVWWWIFTKKEESYHKLFDKKLDEIQELSSEIDYKNLNYNFTTKASGSINFIKFKGPFNLFKKIRDISLEMAEEVQEKYKREFSQIKSGNQNIKARCSCIQQEMLKVFMIWGKKIIHLFNNYSKIKSKSIYRSKHDGIEGRGLKLLMHKQMLQRLPIALTQVKAGNNSESLLNEIRRIAYSLYQSKQITKKVYSSIIKSI